MEQESKEKLTSQTPEQSEIVATPERMASLVGYTIANGPLQALSISIAIMEAYERGETPSKGLQDLFVEETRNMIGELETFRDTMTRFKPGDSLPIIRTETGDYIDIPNLHSEKE